MNSALNAYRYDALESDYPSAVETIRQARARMEAENDQRLQEQARLRAEAHLRAIPLESLLESRGADLRRLEREREQAEHQVIAAVEARIEAELRAIEVDNDRLLEEVRCEEQAQHRLEQAQQELELIRLQEAEESRLTALLSERVQAQQEALQNTAQRRKAEEQALRALQCRAELELDLQVDLQTLNNIATFQLQILGLQRRARGLVRVIWGLGLGLMVLGGATGWMFWGTGH